jgi:hypothetical protein
MPKPFCASATPAVSSRSSRAAYSSKANSILVIADIQAGIVQCYRNFIVFVKCY